MSEFKHSHYHKDVSQYDTIDGRVKSDTVYKDILRAHFETMQHWVEAGLIEVNK